MTQTHIQQNLLKGFNTWYNNSVLTHVLMPEAISLSLGFKFFNTAKVLKESLIGRFGEDDETIIPGPRSYDGTYTELRLSCSGHTLFVQTCVKNDELFILVTPENKSKTPPALLVSAAVLWNKEGYTLLENGHLRIVTPDKKIKVWTNGKELRQLNTGLTNPYIALQLSSSIIISTGGEISIEEISALLKKKKEIILNETKKYGELSECYNAMRTCIAWDTIYEPEKERVVSTVSRLWNITWGGFVLFEWDTYFSSLMAMLENKELAYSNAISITKEKTENGFVPNFAGADDFKSRDRTEPPIGSFTVLEIYKKFGEKWFVEYLFDDLLEWNRWFSKNRMLKNGQICLGSNPYEDNMERHWGKTGVNDLFGAALESGEDNSPKYDDIPFDKKTHLMQLADVGFTSLYIFDCECLSDLAKVIDRKEAAEELLSRACLCKNGLEELWDEETGFYLNKRTDSGEFSRRLSHSNFYALFSDKVSKERADRMIKEHFYNKDEFFGEYIIPTISRNDRAFQEQDYWRGRIWAPTNYLTYLALRRGNQKEAAGVLAEKSKNLLLKEWLSLGHVHENYNTLTGEGCDVKNSDKFYHWGALLSLIALMEEGLA